MREPSKRNDLSEYKSVTCHDDWCNENVLCMFINSDADFTRSAIMFASSAVPLRVPAAAQLLSSGWYRWRFLGIEEYLEYLLDLLPQARVKSMPEVLQFDSLDLSCSVIFRPPLWSRGQSFWLQIQRSRVRSPALPDFLSSSGSETGSTQPREPREWKK